jgi:hypothetical protein
MKKQIVIAILLSFGVSSLAALSLGVNNKVIDQVTLKVGQTVTFQVSSNDAAKYSGYLGFDRDASLGTTFNPQVTAVAGNLASITTVTNTTFEGYYINAAGISPAPSAGIQFTFDYTAVTVGQTMLRLYDSSFVTILDSIVITIVPAQLGSGFTYQGRLIDDNTTPSGEYDIQFKLFNAPFEGSQLGSTIVLDETEVLDGYFTVELDFGSSAFNSNSVWLEVGVRPGNQHNPSPFTLLDPRQRLTPTPHATFASKSDWNTLLNLPAGFADGVDNDTDTHLSESQVEGYIANDVASGYIPYSNGSKLLGTDLYYYSAYESIGFGASAYSNRKLNVSTELNYGIFSETAGTTSTNYAVRASASGNTSSSSYGVYATGSSASGNNYGVYGLTNTASTGTNYAIYGSAANGGTGDAYGGYFVGDTRITGRLNHNYDLQIATDDGAEVGIGISADMNAKLKVYTDTDIYALNCEIANSTNNNIAVRGAANADTTFSSFGVYGIGGSASGNNYGLYGLANTASTGTNYGIFGNASNSGTGDAYAGYFSGDVVVTGYLNGNHDLDIANYEDAQVTIGGTITSDAKLRVASSANTYAIYGKSSKFSSDNYGVYGEGYGSASKIGYGIYGTAFGSSATANYGVYGSATASSTGDNIGVYGFAANLGTGHAYAGYFTGNVYVTGDVSALSFTDRTPYPKDLQTAVDAVMSMSPLPAGQYQESNKEMQLDHTSLSPFIRSEEGKRDLSATVSCHNEVLKDLLSKQKQLEEASLMITQDRATIAAQKEQILQLQSQVVQLQEQVKKMEQLEQKLNMLLSAQ